MYRVDSKTRRNLSVMRNSGDAGICGENRTIEELMDQIIEKAEKAKGPFPPGSVGAAGLLDIEEKKRRFWSGGAD